jgi:hypothetical protein
MSATTDTSRTTREYAARLIDCRTVEASPKLHPARLLRSWISRENFIISTMLSPICLDEGAQLHGRRKLLHQRGFAIQ